MQWSHWFAGMMDTGPSDRMYDCLPMYHSVGGIVAIGAMLVGGGSVVLRPRFSASRFWDDIVAVDCTLFQYIGELCRYLVNSPPHPLETRAPAAAVLRQRAARRHLGAVRSGASAFRRSSNSMPPPKAIVSLYNCEGKPGAIGRIPPFLAHRFPVALVKFDAETGEPLRDAAGRCIRCAADEVGEAIGRIVGRASGSGRFEGYTDQARVGAQDPARRVRRRATLVSHRRSDAAGRERLLLFRRPHRRHVPLEGRERLHAARSRQRPSPVPACVEAVVYGVRVPGNEGRAGMAAIVAGPGVRSRRFAAAPRRAPARLRAPAVPAHALRRSTTTATFKPQKQDLVREGFDPAATADPIYFNDRDAPAPSCRSMPRSSGASSHGEVRLCG